MIIRLPGFCESIFILFILSDSVNFVEYSPFLEIFVDAIARLLYIFNSIRCATGCTRRVGHMRDDRLMFLDGITGFT